MGTNTGLGIGIGIPFKNNALGGDKPYFPPELKARMIGVWTNYGKKNTDADRNIIKNKIPNAGGDLEILNAAYKLNSGFGKYSEDFTTWTKSSKITSVDSESFDFVTNVNWNLLYYKSNIGKDIPSFKVHIKLKGEGKVFYNYITSEGVFTNKVITSEEYVVPISYNTKYTGETPVNCGFSIGVTSEECSGTITQIPNFEDAFVTDGINDMIISQKTLQEMGVTKELTIVSMIHQISWRGSASILLTNYIRNGDTFIRNSISNIGKTGIYGYTCFNIKNVNSSASKVINNILGDKNDYIVEYRGDILSERFSVQGYIDANGNILETSSVAHYWTFAVLGKATEDEINLIIGNYNLDRSLKPDILCNIGKQGITNDNHAEFNDKLIDYSGNGRDIQMNNLAWKGGSGIAAKQYETFKDWTSESSSTSIITQIDEFTRIVESTTNGYWVSRIRRDSDLNKVYDAINVYLYQDNNFLVHECKYEVDGIKYAIPINESVGKGYHKLEMYTKDRYTELPENAENVILSEWYFPKSTKGSIKYSIIPSCKGGILLDGINDFGKVIDMPIYKDYTFIIDREIISIGNTAGIVASKSEDSTDVNKQGAFLFEYLGSPNNVNVWSFYKDNGKVANTDFTRGISYQSKYSYNGIELLAGTALDSDKLWLGILRDKDSRFANVAIYSLMSFPYSMSKFLIERQLKKHKLGTFYPNMVEFRPVIKANANYKITCYQIDSTNTWKLIKVGDYIVIGAKLAFQITFDNDASELKEVVSPQLSDIIVEKRPSNPGYNIYSYITSKSPQKINITIDEYIRYEDIVQPYPVVFQIKDRNTNQIYSWGDKIKVGSSIQLTQGENPNLLSGLYSVQSYEYEGETYTYNQLKALVIIITKSGIQLSCNKVWTFDDNEPKCILSPRLLRIPNSSYKILGYIPDISGHGNHGKINNSAYAGMSGANGYGTNLGNWNSNSPNYGKVINQREEYLEYEVLSENENILFYNVKAVDETFIIYANIDTHIIYSGESNIIANIPAKTPTKVICPKIGTILLITDEIPTIGNIITIQQEGLYEGSYQLDGVDDFIAIPTLSSGGKQVLMKVNWQSIAGKAILYDQRTNGGFAIFNRDFDTNENKVPAYRARNIGGSTYIDGILNEYIYASQLKDTTHNIVELYNPELNIGTLSPRIGCSYLNSNYSQMSLYDFMLFDEISTDDKIQELNKYIGIEAKVELPPYYWDNYGKTNLDADKTTIQQRGVAIGDYDLTNYNHAYEGMSGYNGYPVVFGANKTWANESNGYVTSITSNTIHITNVLNAGLALLYSYVKYNGNLQNIKEIPPFKIEIKGLEGRSKFIYKYLATSDATKETNLYLGNGTHELPKSFLPTEALVNDAVVGFSISPIEEGVTNFLSDITIEVLPEYENGLAYDGITDYSKNANIPALDDFTAIIKREWLKKQGCPLIKGSKVYEGGNGNALLLEWDKAYNFVFYKRTDIMEGELPDNISFITPTNYNGNVITRGSEQDTNGICIAGDGNAGFANMVFYKLILYPKTISLLEINFLKNLMEKDEIIDLNNPIFIKNE